MKIGPHLSKIGAKPHHGISLPLFALHSATTSGIGEFLDLLPLIDWCKSLSLDCIQLLPLNDTGNDPSPYNLMSGFALDPVYISLSELGISPPMAGPTKMEILDLKLSLLKKHFDQTFIALSKTAPYQAFLTSNPWLASYTQFKDPSAPDFHAFIQFHAFRQLALVHSHAQKQNILLQGDLPILMNAHSADVLNHPNLFHSNLSCGAPPDAYNSLGQNWGCPLFNRNEMRKTNYRWWKERVKTFEPLYDLYRIDHVVGFFRIWAVPFDQPAQKGSFYPPDPATWDANGREFLEMLLLASPLLPIAEDLGTIPKSVGPLLKELGIPGTKVMRWERQNETYTPLNEYEPLSVTTLSTPDTDTLALWWKKSPGESVPFAHFLKIPYHPLLSPIHRLQILQAAHQTTSLFHVNLLQEYLALFPELVHPNPEEERINLPGTVLPTNWGYRFRPSVEEIVSHAGLKKAFLPLVIQSRPKADS